MTSQDTTSLLKKYIDKFDYEFLSNERNLSPQAIEAFSPAIMSATAGYSTQSINGLRRIHDMHKEGKYIELLAVIGDPIDNAEFLQVEICSKLIYEFAKSFLDYRSTAPTNILATLNYHRLVNQRTADLDSLSILEIGPGCGNLPLVFSSHPKLNSYRLVENTQSCYLYQSILWEFAESYFDQFSCDCNQLSFFREKFKSHLSAWNFANLDSEIPPSNVIISNHCLAEMHEQALICYAKRIMDSWRNNKIKNGRWIAQSLGASNINWSTLIEIMRRAGFKLIESASGFSKFSRIFVWRDSLADPLPYESDIIKLDERLQVINGINDRVLKNSFGYIPSMTGNVFRSKYHKLFNHIEPNQEKSLGQIWKDFIN